MPNKSSPHGGFISAGTIIHGTLRTADLLRAFADEYERVLPFNGRAMADEARNIAGIMSAADLIGAGSVAQDEEASDMLSALFDALDEIAQREGFYFGASEGDGSDFGYWTTEEE